MRWVLPDFIQDELPAEAAEIERVRRLMLDAFRVRGYRLVQPPLLEYLDSLITGSGHDLELKTFKLVDQLSGRMMGVRADTTPQVARIDAHLLNHSGVTRLCYCGSVVHALPATLTATREPIQIGAELYGHEGIEADAEIIRLLAEVLSLAGLPAERIDVGHVGLFRALTADAGLDAAREEALFDLLQAKDVPGLAEALEDIAEPQRSALLALPNLYGGADVLERARAALPALPEVEAALADLEQIASRLQGVPLSFDLSDLRGYHYHSGVVFAAYAGSSAAALALGGRYDFAGEAFGRGRPATGFSLDLRQFARHSRPVEPAEAILAPLDDDPALAERVAALRAEGQIVINELPGHPGTWEEAGCNRRLVRSADGWSVVALHGER